jgi:predicted nucleotidyltransferase
MSATAPAPAPLRGADPALVAALREALSARQDIRLALLYGSHARGRARPDSDVDVAALGADLNPFALGARLSLAVDWEVEVLDLAQATHPLLKAILRDGVVLHEGERHAAARWRTGAIIEVETDGPAFDRMRDAYLAALAERAGGR